MKTELQTSIWGDRFNSLFTEALVDNLGLKHFACTNSLDYSVGGNYFSTEYNHIQIEISKWSGYSYCKSESEINSSIEISKIGVAMTDYYFDSNDYSNPIKINPSIVKSISSLKWINAKYKSLWFFFKYQN